MNTGSALARFTITLSQAVTEPVQVEWFTSDGTAKAGVDYAANKGTVTFAPGETSKTVDILVYGRAVGSEDRTFFVEMLPPTNAILGASIGECIITVDTSGSTPVTAIIVPTGPKGDKGEPGEDGISPDPAEIAVEVAPLIDVGSTVLTAQGTESLSKPDTTTVKAVARRVAYAAAAKIATVTLAAGDNLIAKADLTGDAVDFNSPGIYPRIMRGTSILSPAWSLETDGRLLIKSALAGDLLYVCQYDFVSGEKLNTNVRELWRRLLAEAGYTLVDGSFEKGASVTTSKQAVWHSGGAQCYAWNGALPKTVPADSTPIGTGGISSGAWSSMTAVLLRSQLAAKDGFTRIGSVASMADLASVDTSSLQAGDKIYVNAYHADSFFLGGRWLFWDPATSKSAHNGITIFDPTKSFGDWSVRADRTAWYTATNSTNGVWRSERHGMAVDADFAGARPYNASAIDTETGTALTTYLNSLAELVDVVCGAGIYRWNLDVKGGVRGHSYGTEMRFDDNTKPIIRLGYKAALGSGWAWKLISDISFNGESATRATAEAIGYADYASDVELTKVGRYVFDRLVFTNLSTGIRKLSGNIGATYRNCATQNIDYMVWGTSKATAPQMNSGNDTYEKCNFSGCMLSATRYDSNIIAGSELDIVYRQCLFQYNTGYAIRMRSPNSEAQHNGCVLIDNCWFEANGTIGSTVVIDGVAEQPVDLYFQNIRNIKIVGCAISSVRLVNASIAMDYSSISDVRGASYYLVETDARSFIYSENDRAQFGRPLQGLVVNSVLFPHASGANGLRDGFVATHRRTKTNLSLVASYGYGCSFDRAASMNSATGSLYASTQVQDALLGTYASRWTIPASTIVTITNPNNLTMTVGKYYVWSVDIRWIDAGDATVQLSQAGGATLSRPLVRSVATEAGYRTFAGLGYYNQVQGDNRCALRINGGTVSTTIQTSMFQVVMFDSLSEAISWFNSGMVLGKNSDI